MIIIREVLFKAKLKDWKTNPQQNKWVEGYYLSRKETTYCFTEDYEKNPVKTLHYIAVDSMTDWGLPNEFRLYEIDSDTLCQYTEEKDVNENKVWENDVVKMIYRENDTEIGIIRYDKKDFRYRFCVDDVQYSFDISDKFEVIGNKFDNPELV